MDAVLQLSPTVGAESACDVLGVARPTPARALSCDEREPVRAVLNSERFQDCSPAAIQATLLNEGQYLCSTVPFWTAVITAWPQLSVKTGKLLWTSPTRLIPNASSGVHLLHHTFPRRSGSTNQ
jgi:hypothetical protein